MSPRRGRQQESRLLGEWLQEVSWCDDAGVRTGRVGGPTGAEFARSGLLGQSRRPLRSQESQGRGGAAAFVLGGVRSRSASGGVHEWRASLGLVCGRWRCQAAKDTPASLRADKEELEVDGSGSVVRSTVSDGSRAQGGTLPGWDAEVNLQAGG